MTSSLRFSWLQRLRGVVRFPVLTATEKTDFVAVNAAHKPAPRPAAAAP